MKLNNIIISMQSDVTGRGKLTGEEGDLLRDQVSLTLNRDHLDRVLGACCQTGEVVGESSSISPIFSIPLRDLHTVMTDVTRPGKPFEGGALGSHISHVDLEREMFCG